MQELNEAWAVLRSPAKRAAYDDELARQAAGTGPSEQRSALRTVADDPSLVDPTPMSARPTTDDVDSSRGCVLFLGLVVVLVVIAVVAAILVAWGSQPPDAVEVRTREKYAVGTCVLVIPGDPNDPGSVTVQEVACSGTGARSGRVVAKVKVPLPCPKDSAAVVLPDEAVSVCITR